MSVPIEKRGVQHFPRLSRFIPVFSFILSPYKQISATYDPETAATVYQSVLIERGGEISEDTIDKRHLLAAYAKLNKNGRKELVRRAEEMTEIPKFQLVQNLTFIDGKRSELQAAYQSLDEAILEKSLMEKSQRKSPNVLRSNTEIITEKTEKRQILSWGFLRVVLERSKTDIN